MRPAKNLKKIIKKAAIKTDAKVNQAVLSDLLKKLPEAREEKSILSGPNIRRTIMRSNITKLAAATVIIIAVFIGIDQFDTNGSSVAWADITERFESVPFFSVTIYVSQGATTKAQKIEIWKSETSQVRAHEGNKVIFANFADGNNAIAAFDRSTKQPVNTMGLLSAILLPELCPEGRFSLDTIINSFPSEVKSITPVEIADTAASREIVVFEAKHKTTPERLSIWALRKSKLPIQLRFRDPRNNECGDFLFNYSEKKGSEFFNPEAFTSQ